MGSMDRPVWWDEEMIAAVVAHCTECTHAARSC
jgi:hypothetical protein